MAATRTIYVKDQALWERAKGFAGEGLSAVIAQLLGDWVRKQEALRRHERGELTDIQLWVGGQMHQEEHSSEAHYIAFTGRLIVTNEDLGPEALLAEGKEPAIAKPMPLVRAYQTRTGALVVYRDWRETASEQGATYYRFNDFAALQRFPYALHATWIDERAEFVESPVTDKRLMREIASALGELLVVRVD